MAKTEQSHVIYAAVALIVGLALVGSYSYFRYQELSDARAKARQADIEKKEKDQKYSDNKALLDICMQKADAKADYNMKINATRQGVNYSIPTELLRQIESKRNSEKELCTKMYPTY